MAAQSLALVLALTALVSIHASPAGQGGSLFAGAVEDGGGGKKTAAAVTEIRIDKSDHTLKLLAGSDVVKTYKVAIGSGGMGPKRFEGDKTTPVGTYKVQGRFKGLFHQFLNVTYPNDEDRARYKELKAKGVVPAGRGVGFGIGIHGVGDRSLNDTHKLADWTHGCIALNDDEIDELSRMVKDGTKIVITD